MDRALRRSRALTTILFGPPAERDFRIRYWDGSADEPPDSLPPRFTLVLRHPGALRRMLVPPTERALGTAYLCDDFDIEGDAEAAAGLAGPLVARLSSPRTLLALAGQVLALPARGQGGGEGGRGGHRGAGTRHSRERDAAAVRYHYDVGNDFYRIWLDRRMVYSCGYFPSGTEDLEAAQEAKLEHICRKLRLSPGERLLDIGCGWGALVQYAAERFGVEAVGITLSEAQAALARERIAAAGLEGRCRIEVRDYRDLPAERHFDKIASVGMVEHVGGSRLPDYYRHAYRLLAPGGLFLNHGIVSLHRRPTRLGRALVRAAERWHSFMQHYVFPDSELVSPTELIAPAEAAGFEVRDVESLREHYAQTLRHWLRRLEENRAEAVACTSEATYRVWRIYMAGAAFSFEAGRNGIVQLLLGKRDGAGRVQLPPTRADLYAPGRAS